ncbi:MAG: mannosyltransferase [Acidocella sp.]|nr:mannosyltransferase [Acidocella sp.]
MAPHPLEETLSADILLPAIYLVEACRGQAGLRSISAAGFLLGLAFALREQLAPAIAIAGIFLCRRSPQRWALALAAASLPVLAAGLLDWFTWGQMFRSFWMNIYLNLGRGVASGYFDSSSPAYYPLNLLYAWLWSALFIAYFAWQGARKLPVAGACAAAIIITHCLIAHKEMRFIFPATTLLIPLAGIGLAGACAKRKYLLMACILAGPYMSPVFLMMVQWQDSASTFYTALARQHPCLVSIQTWNRGFWPIFPVFDARTRFTGPPLPGEVAPDAIVASADTAQIPPGFTRQACAPESWIPFHKRLPEICYWTRPVTACAQGPSTPFTLVFPPAARPFIIPGRLPLTP